MNFKEMKIEELVELREKLAVKIDRIIFEMRLNTDIEKMQEDLIEIEEEIISRKRKE